MSDSHLQELSRIWLWLWQRRYKRFYEQFYPFFSIQIQTWWLGNCCGLYWMYCNWWDQFSQFYSANKGINVKYSQRVFAIWIQILNWNLLVVFEGEPGKWWDPRTGCWIESSSQLWRGTGNTHHKWIYLCHWCRQWQQQPGLSHCKTTKTRRGVTQRYPGRLFPSGRHYSREH